MRTVDAVEFRDALKPTVVGLRAFANAVGDLDQRSSPPAGESRAMSEIAAEQALSERSAWNDPLSAAHSNGALTLRAAADYVRGFAQVFTPAGRAASASQPRLRLRITAPASRSAISMATLRYKLPTSSAETASGSAST